MGFLGWALPWQTLTPAFNSSFIQAGALHLFSAINHVANAICPGGNLEVMVRAVGLAGPWDVFLEKDNNKQPPSIASLFPYSSFLLVILLGTTDIVEVGKHPHKEINKKAFTDGAIYFKGIKRWLFHTDFLFSSYMSC